MPVDVREAVDSDRDRGGKDSKATFDNACDVHLLATVPLPLSLRLWMLSLVEGWGGTMLALGATVVAPDDTVSGVSTGGNCALVLALVRFTDAAGGAAAAAGAGEVDCCACMGIASRTAAGSCRGAVGNSAEYPDSRGLWIGVCEREREREGEIECRGEQSKLLLR